MIGGGQGAFIGGVHRTAAAIDGEIELVCGAFSSTPEKSRASGEALYLPPDRVYGNFEEMIQREKQLPEGERMDFVSIVTPNHLHFPPAKLALENGFHVVCDKPITFTLSEARQLRELVNKTGLLFCLTHNYTGYPMVKEARQMIRNGKLGNLRKIVVEYPQGWLAKDPGNKQSEWRMDPKRAGIANCMGDIGVHAANMVEYVTGLKITEMCADLTSFVDNRELEDDGNVLLHFEKGAKGILHASQISAGEENDFNFRIYGEIGGLKWRQMEPNTLVATWLDRPTEMIRTGVGLGESANISTRLPAGHPEGYLEAFANLYRNFAITLRSRLNGQEPNPAYLDFPGVEEGVRGMLFIETVVASGNSQQKWVKMPE